jgi:hypothetical protein
MGALSTYYVTSFDMKVHGGFFEDGYLLTSDLDHMRFYVFRFSSSYGLYLVYRIYELVDSLPQVSS